MSEVRGTGLGDEKWGGEDRGPEPGAAVAFGAMTSVRTDSGSAESGRRWIDPDALPGPVAQLLIAIRTPATCRRPR